jgi:hypothetical protein
MEEYESGRKDTFELLLGDEFFLPPIKDRMTACAYTNREIKIRWKPINKYWPEGQMDEIRKTITEEAYLREFGQYK